MLEDIYKELRRYKFLPFCISIAGLQLWWRMIIAEGFRPGSDEVMMINVGLPPLLLLSVLSVLFIRHADSSKILLWGTGANILVGVGLYGLVHAAISDPGMNTWIYCLFMIKYLWVSTAAVLCALFSRLLSADRKLKFDSRRAGSWRKIVNNKI